MPPITDCRSKAPLLLPLLLLPPAPLPLLLLLILPAPPLVVEEEAEMLLLILLVGQVVVGGELHEASDDEAGETWHGRFEVGDEVLRVAKLEPILRVCSMYVCKLSSERR